MKKIFLMVAVSGLVFCSARADWLVWCVSTGDFDTEEIKDVSKMRVGVVNGSSKDPFWSGTALSSWDASWEAPVTDVAYTGKNAQYYVDVSGLSTGSYSFYIELLNSKGERVGRTGNNTTFSYASYSDLSDGKYITTGDIGEVATVNVWHGGAFEAVPEPSSMALLALGAGLVGLRRKLRKNKKGKRA